MLLTISQYLWLWLVMAVLGYGITLTKRIHREKQLKKGIAPTAIDSFGWTFICSFTGLVGLALFATAAMVHIYRLF